ncbi:hypothetical protein [Deinococcus sp.]|uniref:glycoside hydrolase family 38 N-terminal domain-containing protein n=1 Tax=Deinococcus sp. TaxID=47478 RepID=UPI003CC5DF6F
MVKELWLIHHTHTDIGYTHPQEIVFELHHHFLDDALDLIEKFADYPDDARFRWTCESAGIAWRWWQASGAGQRRRFLAAVEAGTMDVAALRWNMTPLADHALFATQLRDADHLRAEGISIRSAMQSDIDGLPWGTVRLLLDHGIDGFSMAINEHFGRAASPRPGAFWWEAPDGARLLTSNNPHYHSTPNRAMLLGVGNRVQDSQRAVAAYLTELDAHGYTLPMLGVQPTNRYFSDNDAPDHHLPGFVKEWNESGSELRLRLCTLTQYFDRLRQEAAQLPTVRGDWTDWWNFGAGSTARETRLHMRGQRDLRAARQLQAWSALPERASMQAEEAEDALTLYAEHTWGAHSSISDPTGDETLIQQSHKLAYAYRGAALARFLKRDALLNLARQLPAERESLLVYNPHPFAVRAMLRVPEGLRDFAELFAHLAQRIDVQRDGRMGAEQWVGPLELPGLGYAVLPLDGLEASSEGLESGETSIGNGRVTATFDPVRGGLSSLRVGEREYVRSGERLGQLVLEWPTAGERSAIFGPPDWTAFDMHGAWHHDWDAARESAAVQRGDHASGPGAAEYVQHVTFSNGEYGSVTYRVHPGEAALHLSVKLHLEPLATPRSTYLHLPFSLSDSARTHFETAGALVEFDREQLPGSSRHYVTALDWLRMQDDEAGVSVAAPDAPLWQIGGYTFGRFDGEKPAPFAATLNAWLTNNYWDTNFQADQAGDLRFDFTLLLHAAEDLSISAVRAAPHSQPPELHPFGGTASAGSGDSDAQADSPFHLLDAQFGGVLLLDTRYDATTKTLHLMVLNPTDQARTLRFGAGRLTPLRARLTTLAGTSLPGEPALELTVAGRWWGQVVLELE